MSAAEAPATLRIGTRTFTGETVEAIVKREYGRSGGTLVTIMSTAEFLGLEHGVELELTNVHHSHNRESARKALAKLAAEYRVWAYATEMRICNNSVGHPTLERVRRAARRCERYLGKPAREIAPELYDLV